MKKLYVLIMAVAVAMMLASPAMATKSRVRAMGDVGNYIEDDYNIFTWYATLPSYANVLTIELINDDYYHDWGYYEPYLGNGYGMEGGEYEHKVNAMFGLIKGLGEENAYGTLGIFFTEVAMGPNRISGDIASLIEDLNSSAGMMGLSPVWYQYGLFSNSVYNKFMLMYGYGADGMSFGLHFSRSDQNMKGELEAAGMTGESELNMAYTTIGVGARFDIGESAYGDVAFDYNMASFTDELNWPFAISEDAGSMFNGRARVFYEYNDYLTIVPYVGFSWWDFALDAEDDSYYMGYACHGNKGMMIDFGIGTDWMVNDENTIILAVEPYKYMKMEPSTCVGDNSSDAEATMVTFPRFLLALESEITDWMTLRTGCTKDLTKWEGKFSGEVEGEDFEFTGSMTEAPFCFYVGLGFQVADFEFDCVVNEEVPFSMGYWLTGYRPDDGDRTPIWMISAKYHF